VLPALVFGVAPALRCARLDVRTSLREGERGTAGGRHARRLGDGLVAAELAVCLVLASGAALMVRSFWERQRADPGFVVRDALTARVALSGAAYRGAAGRVAFVVEALRRIRELPAVQSAAAVTALPMSDGFGGGWSSVTVDAQDRPRVRVRPRIPAPAPPGNTITRTRPGRSLGAQHGRGVEACGAQRGHERRAQRDPGEGGGTSVNVTGSVAATPTSTLDIARARPAPTSRPAPSPSATSEQRQAADRVLGEGQGDDRPGAARQVRARLQPAGDAQVARASCRRVSRRSWASWSIGGSSIPTSLQCGDHATFKRRSERELRRGRPRSGPAAVSGAGHGRPAGAKLGTGPARPPRPDSAERRHDRRVTRTALVTGGNRGIGLEVCRQLARKGLRVWLAARDVAAGREAAAELAREGEVRALRLDVASEASIREALQVLAGAGAGAEVDVLVNNAGIYPSGSLLRGDLGAFRETMDVHFFGPLLLCRALVPGMLARGYGRVVNVSSGYGALGEGLEGPAAYSVSKAALNALTIKLAGEVSGDVKANAACPGWVRTRMGGRGAPTSVEDGAATIVWLATLPAGGPNGGFFRRRRRIHW
jgi:NAD(P)-dependent dehydrogenase (short-subunit alcohol dehydrogenase family)